MCLFPSAETEKNTVMLDHRSSCSNTLLPAIKDEWIDCIFSIREQETERWLSELIELIKSIRSSLSSLQSLYHNLGSQILPQALMNMII